MARSAEGGRMTCIVALRHDGVIHMGCDSAGVGGWSRQNRADPKIYRIAGQMLIGFTTSFRMGQLLGHSLTLPRHHADVPVSQYMVTTFVDAVRNCLKAGGWAEKDKDQERGGTFIVAYKGQIFEVQSDYQVAQRDEPYTAVGCGEDLALGALYASGKAGMKDPRARIELALTAAAEFSAGVYGPFRFEEIKA
jgi:ATP-dependent protease HslVU (ClpYQ) peptidase subunit